MDDETEEEYVARFEETKDWIHLTARYQTHFEGKDYTVTNTGVRFDPRELQERKLEFLKDLMPFSGAGLNRFFIPENQ